jgi:hypothetical protein
MSKGGFPDYRAKIETLFGANIVGYWPMNEASGTTCNDASASNKDLTYSGVTLGQPGIGDGKTCPYFDGVNDAVASGWAQLSGTLNITEGSLMVWSKPVGGWSAATTGGLVEMTNMGGTNIMMNKGQGAVELWGTGGWAYIKSSYTGWLHIGHTWSATSGKRFSYIDGNPVSDGVAFTTLPGGFPAAFQVGSGWLSNNWFNGWMAHIVLLDRAATASEMRQAASVHNVAPEADWTADSDYIDLIQSTFGANVIGHWPFNETRGYLLHDISGHAKSGLWDQWGVIFNHEGIGDGLTSTHIDKTVYASANIYPVSPIAYDKDEGTIMIWGKNTDAWATSDGYLFYISNQVGAKFGIKTTTNGVGVYSSQGTSIYGSYTGPDWFHAAYTWSKAANETKMYIDGVQVGSTQTCAGGWADPVQIITFGELQVSGPFDGYLAHAVLLNRPATPAEIEIVAAAP